MANLSITATLDTISGSIYGAAKNALQLRTQYPDGEIKLLFNGITICVCNGDTIQTICRYYDNEIFNQKKIA